MRGATEAFAPAEGYFSFQLAHPVRGATRREPVIFLPSAISTPAPHEGCDWNFRATRPWSEFQLTHSMHGCDRHGRVWRRETCHFNSRTRVGCDKIKWYTINTPKISTPAPMQGVTLAASIAMSLCSFQFPHPAWGATRLIPCRPWKSDISIPAPCEGCDIILIKKKRRRLVFQFTHPVWGAAQRLRTDILKIIIKYFNSRTLMRYGLTVSP